MPYIAISKRIVTQQTLFFDLNVLNGTTTPIRIESQSLVTFQVLTVAVTAVVALEFSLDGTNWFPTVVSSDINGNGALDSFVFTGVWLRAKVTTAEGGAATGTVDIFAR